MVDFTNATTSDSHHLASSSNSHPFQDDFLWDWYIRLKVTFPAGADTNLYSNLDNIQKEFDCLWQGIKSRFIQEESQLWPETLVDSSRAYFWLIGISTPPSPQLVEYKELLQQWQKSSKDKMKGIVTKFEAKLIPRKVFLGHGFEVYTSSKPESGGFIAEVEEPGLSAWRSEKSDEGIQSPGKFKKIKGSNPQEIRRQFLEHNIKASGSSTSNSKAIPSGKLRSVREVLNRMKFDLSYNTKDYVVGYIDRKAGILEKSVDEWGDFGQEELIAYVKNVKENDIVWDKARKIDLVFGIKGD